MEGDNPKHHHQQLDPHHDLHEGGDEDLEECDDSLELEEEDYDPLEMEHDGYQEEGTDDEMEEEKSIGPSTYESISDIQLDQDQTTNPSGGCYRRQINSDIPQVIPSVTMTTKINNDTRNSRDASSVSFNTVPEDFTPVSKPPKKPTESYKTNEQIEECAEDEANESVSNTQSSEECCERNETISSVPSTKGPSITQCIKQTKTSSALKRKSKSPSRAKQNKSKKGKLTSPKKDNFKSHSPSSSKCQSRLKNNRSLIKLGNQTTADPDAPKRPLTAFKIFMNDFRDKYSKMYPNITFAEMTDIGAEVWRDMPAEKKAEFQEESSKQQDEYLNQFREYQAKKQHERSVRPKTAYQIFMSDYLNKEYIKRQNLKTPSRLTKQDLFMRGVRKWNRMTKSQKRTYEDQARNYKCTQSFSDHHPMTLTCSNSPKTHTTTASNESESPSETSLIPVEATKGFKRQETKVVPLPEPTPPKKQRRIEFSEEDKVGQFRADDTLETWYQAAKGF